MLWRLLKISLLIGGPIYLESGLPPALAELVQLILVLPFQQLARVDAFFVELRTCLLYRNVPDVPLLSYIDAMLQMLGA